MATRDYEGVGITVHWDSERCIHAERCVNGAPTVFDRSRRPWIDLAGADADEVARVIDTCPSGALGYTRTDGVAARAVPEVPVAIGAPRLVPEEDGPYVVVGPLALVEPDGSTRVLVRATLCRCGHSTTKPFCDGSHSVVGFRAPGVVDPYAVPTRGPA